MYRSVSFEDDPRWDFHRETTPKDKQDRRVTLDSDRTSTIATPYKKSESSDPRYPSEAPVQSPPFVVNHNHNPTMPKTNKQWKNEVETLKEELRRQDERIQQLERENKQLRSKLEDRESPQEPPTSQEAAPADDDRQQASKPFVHFQDPPDPIRTTPPPRRHSSRYSPGSHFVAELTHVMDLNVGHHTLLASIMDEHFERQARGYYADERLR
jgi:hypothetical protein